MRRALVFPTTHRNHDGSVALTYQWFHRRFREWIAELYLGHCVPHQARHTLATNLLRAGASLTHIRRILAKSVIGWPNTMYTCRIRIWRTCCNRAGVRRLPDHASVELLEVDWHTRASERVRVPCLWLTVPRLFEERRQSRPSRTADR